MICDFLIIGGDGDLAFRKLYPSLYHLEQAGCLPPCLKIVGISRSEGDQNSFRQKVREKFDSYHSETADEKVWQVFNERLHYAQVDATSESG
ncbi:MAG: glucose-6-phosphate dehydrogenase, partial [Gammaproteobacteria bacterium]|nr:glucose-6-phosphate dehydrogenase [Gammaproteobacteria bacterium]